MTDKSIFDPNKEDSAWINYRSKFSDVYDESNYKEGLQSWAMNSSHRLLEKNISTSCKFSQVLEIGAGTGEHLRHVKHDFDSYLLTDHDQKALDVAKNKLEQVQSRGCFKFSKTNGYKLDYKSNSFDRTIATHVLEHIPNPHLAIKEWARVTKNNGVLSILIPTDPGIAWRLGRKIGPRRNALKQGIAYDYVMAREHVNSCVNLLALLKHYFPQAEESWWPFKLPSVDANLFVAINVIIKK